MKKQAYTMIALLVLVGSMAVAAQAQTSGRNQLIANIPFEFNVGSKTLPAGEYTVRQIYPASDHAVLLLRDKAGNSAMIQMNTAVGKANEQARLVFSCYGGQHYFSQAWTSGEATGLEASPSRAERRASEIAGLKSKTESVALRVR